MRWIIVIGLVGACGGRIEGSPSDTSSRDDDHGGGLPVGVPTSPSKPPALPSAPPSKPPPPAAPHVDFDDPSPCLAGGNMLVLDGNDYIHSGYEVIDTSASRWTSDTASAHDTVSVSSQQPGGGEFWFATFSSHRKGILLEAGEYDDAVRYPFGNDGENEMSVDGDGRGCNQLSGRFRVHEIAWSTASLASFTVTFEQHCEKGSSVLRGCLHYEMTDAGP